METIMIDALLQLGSIEGYLLTILIWVGIYGLMALGLNIQWGQTGLFNIGVIGFVAVGGYTSATLTIPQSAEYFGGFGLPFPVGLIGGMLAAGFVGFLIAIPVLRLREDYLAIATIGFQEIIRLLYLNEEWYAGGPRGLRVEAPLNDVWSEVLPWLNFNWLWVAILVVLVGTIYVVLERLNQSPFGRVLKSIREDEDVSRAAGKNVYRYKMRSFVFGCMIMGAAGSVQAHYIGYINPDFFWPLITFYVWIALLLGGSGNNKGAILGAGILMLFLEGTNFLKSYVPFLGSTQVDAVRYAVVGLLLIALMQYRPEGVLGERKTLFGDGDRSGGAADAD
jgi:branched-chain amino acid transport system permease protein